MANYLLEIGTEEIPAKFLPGVLAQLRELAAKKLEEHRLKYEQIETLGTPRRIALLVLGLAEKGEDLQEEIKGPAKKAAFAPDGTPTKAVEGFARSQGVALDKLQLKEIAGGEYVFAVREVKGKAAREVLPAIAPQLITGLNFPKPMRWADKEMRFARPIRWLVSLLDKEIIPVELEGLQAGRVSRGHRLLGAERVEIREPLSYVEQLKKEFVLADQNVRKSECWKQIEAAAAQADGKVEPDEELLEEITHLVEWPTALLGNIGEEYLSMPEEAIITPMKEHQRYFPVRDKDGALLNHFITVRNGNDQYLDTVRAGNEKVLKARLADARFFWLEDQKTALADYLPRLEKIVFQESLGTVAQKVERIKKNVEKLAERLQLPAKVQENAQRAALLAKADLVTSMVYEFPELQGLMGRYYAELSGESREVARAIKEHYQPRFAGDEIPTGTEGALVSIADKLDTIAGCFAIGIEPTGSQDPYALRRQAMGICLIIIGHKFELELDDLIRMALDSYRGIVAEENLGADTQLKIKEFFQARIRNILSEEGHRYDVVESVLGVEYSSLLTTLKRAAALSALKDDPQFGKLLTSFTRAYNLTKKAGTGDVNPAYLQDQTEKQLYKVLREAEEKTATLSKKRDFAAMIEALSPLAGPIDEFFNAVMVMAEDEQIKNNRLALLRKIVALTRPIGDLSKIVLG